MTITSADATRMYPVWKWLGISREEFYDRIEDRAQDSDNGVSRRCAVEDCERVYTNTATLCPPHMGAYRRKRAQVIRSMGA